MHHHADRSNTATVATAVPLSLSLIDREPIVATTLRARPDILAPDLAKLCAVRLCGLEHIGVIGTLAPILEGSIKFVSRGHPDTFPAPPHPEQASPTSRGTAQSPRQ